ncbi:hypothetical protein K432DRAFT_125300 [Lepidopterella palustris CBS 459.81]|uniref:Uncharacterized protein n=1 Tax=Lepidopterella palustris CBS 459.81 TaxID=1314670 RepID=A0A8E2EIX3_9PEZI|nr:hypothetical protein K432DRAFT_125300 [Lepidopterella palustris CBS 459.81]
MDIKHLQANAPGSTVQTPQTQPPSQPTSPPPPTYTAGTIPIPQQTSPVQFPQFTHHPTSPLATSSVINDQYSQPTSPHYANTPPQIGANGQQQMHYMQHAQQSGYLQQQQQGPPPLQTHQPVPQSADMIYSMEKQRKAERNARMKKQMGDACADGCSWGARLCVCCTACMCAFACSQVY